MERNQCGTPLPLTLGAEEQPKPSLLDELISRRAQIARRAKEAVAKLDRQINVLRQSEAETIVREAREALDNSY